MSVSIGLLNPSSSTLLEILFRSSQPCHAWFDFACSPLFPREPRTSPLGASSSEYLNTDSWRGRCVGLCLQDGDIRRECMWANHLGVGMVLSPFPGCSIGGSLDYQLSRQLVGALQSLDSSSCWLCIRIKLSALGDDAGRWRGWNTLRTLCGHSCRLGICLEVDGQLPCPLSVQRWLAEPVRLVELPTFAFSMNVTGFPALCSPLKDLVRSLVGTGAGLLVSGNAAPSLPERLLSALNDVLEERSKGDPESLRVLESSPILAYAAYLRHVSSSSEQPLTSQQTALLPWRHALLAPLQPLAHNLSSATYEVFERDSPKYDAYQRAVEVTLEDWRSKGLLSMWSAAQGSASSGNKINFTVLGAGRGPLVSRILAACLHVGLPVSAVKVHALEKNPFACIHLRTRGVAEAWGDSVEVIEEDGRLWKPPCPIDILVSELLGSFGDNELSPECLAYAESFLRVESGDGKPGGVCIPSSYTSFVAPITCPTLWGSVAERGRVGKFEGDVGKGGNCFDVGFVTRMPNAYPISPPLPAFTFSHPLMAGEDFSRVAALTFSLFSNHPTLLHGFAGYFHATLAPGVFLSTVPQSHTHDMHSWFPLFFPLRTPVTVEGGEVRLHIWRCREALAGMKGRVWYEWTLESPVAGPLQNSQGNSWEMSY